MGQQASKAVRSRMTRAAAAMTKSESSSPQELTKQVPRTHPSNTAGFQRGDATKQDIRDTRQQQFLRQQAGGVGAPVEMPDDLVKFLKDVGPLKKRPQQMPSHQKPEGSLTNKDMDTPKPSSSRRREFMPLATNVEGFETERTTNFSYDNVVATESTTGKEGQFDVLGLYRIVTDKDFPNSTVSDPIIQQWIRDTQRYLEVPVIVKDSDDDEGYIGVHPQKFESLHLEPVPKTIVKLVLEDLVESRQQEEEASL